MQNDATSVTGSGIRRFGSWLRRPAVSMTLVAATVLFTGLGQGDLRLDGALYGWVSKRMAETGDWLNPYFDWGDTPYFNKPPLQFWMTGACIRLFGATDFAAKLPSVLFGFGCVILTWRIARRFLAPSAAATAGLVLATTYTFVRNMIGFRLDGGVTFCFLAVMWAAVELLEPRLPARARGWPWVVMGLGIGGGLMIKGAIVLMSLPVVLAAFALARRWDLLLNVRWLLALGVASLIALPWHLYMIRRWGDAFTSIFFGQQVMERLERAIHRPKPWYYYLQETATYYWPWLPLAAWGLWSAVRDRARRTAIHWLPAAWFALYFASIHAVPSKFDRYLLPLFPLLAIAAAGALYRTRFADVWDRRVLPWAGTAAASVGIALTLLDVPMHRTTWPELHAAVPVIDAALDSGDATSPVVYATKEVRLWARCNLLFYSDRLDRARYRYPAPRRLSDLPPGSFLMVPVADAAYVRETLPAAQSISAGKSVVIFKI